MAGEVLGRQADGAGRPRRQAVRGAGRGAEVETDHVGADQRRLARGR